MGQNPVVIRFAGTREGFILSTIIPDLKVLEKNGMPSSIGFRLAIPSIPNETTKVFSQMEVRRATEN